MICSLQDDGCLAGDFETLGNAMDIIKTEGPQLGLHPNIAKCQVYGFGALPPENMFQGLEMGQHPGKI